MVEQPSTLPDVRRDGELAFHGVHHRHFIEGQSRLRPVQVFESAADLISNLETSIAQSRQQTIHRALRTGVRQDARDASPNCEIAALVEQPVGELSEHPLGVASQIVPGRIGQFIPRQQTDDLRDRQWIEAGIGGKRPSHPRWISAEQLPQPVERGIRQSRRLMRRRGGVG